MCGRFVTGADEHSWRSWAAILELSTDVAPEVDPDTPFVPTHTVPFVRSGHQHNELAWARWGLAPSWMKRPLQQPPQYNVRSETAPTKFKKYFTSRRCVLPASGFWVRRATAGEHAFVTVPDAPLFALAGLWTERELDGETLRSCTILTTAAAADLAHLHDRAPVILLADQAKRWLAADCPTDELAALCKAPPALAIA